MPDPDDAAPFDEETIESTPSRRKSKLSLPTPSKIMRGSSSHSSKGRKAPTKSSNGEIVHSGTTLENYVLPPALRMDTGVGDDNTANQGNNVGMEVIKVSKVCGCSD